MLSITNTLQILPMFISYSMLHRKNITLQFMYNFYIIKIVMYYWPLTSQIIRSTLLSCEYGKGFIALIYGKPRPPHTSSTCCPFCGDARDQMDQVSELTYTTRHNASPVNFKPHVMLFCACTMGDLDLHCPHMSCENISCCLTFDLSWKNLNFSEIWSIFHKVTSLVTFSLHGVFPWSRTHPWYQAS